MPQAQTLKRSFEAEIVDTSKKSRSVTARINTDVVDRYRTVIDPMGGDTRNFMKAPAVLWEHGQDPKRGRLPIGHCSSCTPRRNERDIIARTFFKSDDFSQQLFEWYADETLKGWSIDFLPDERSCSPPTREEKRARPELAECQMMYRKWEMTGYSAVAYAGNPEALTLAVERGLWVPEEVRRSLPPPKRAMGEGTGAAGGYTTKTQHGRYITEAGGEWIVHAEDGQVLGKHKTKAEAEAQLAAVEAHKKDGRTLELPPLRGRTLEDVQAAVERRTKGFVRGLIEQAYQDAQDLARGQV